MRFLGIACLALFFIAAAVHLIASYQQNNKLRAYSKGFLLLSLLGWYCFTVSEPSLMVAAALLTSWLGDALLIPKGVKWFACGGTAFFLSHVCFALAYAPQIGFSAVPLWLVILAAAVYIAAVGVLSVRYRKYLPKVLFLPMLGYLLTNGLMNVFALFQLYTLPALSTALVYGGAVLFFTSDACLFSLRFNKSSRFKSHFLVMLTYLLGEFLIVLGMILLSRLS